MAKKKQSNLVDPNKNTITLCRCGHYATVLRNGKVSCAVCRNGSHATSDTMDVQQVQRKCEGIFSHYKLFNITTEE